MSRFSKHPLLRLIHFTSATLLTVFRRLARSKGRSPNRVSQKQIKTVANSPILWLGLALALVSLIGVTLPAQNWIAPVSAITMPLPLSTNGTKIVDARGQTVLLKGVNWFGIETELHAPYGLQSRDYKDMLAQIKSLGYNMIRLPYSVQSLRSSNMGGVNFQLGSNQELLNKSPLQVMDAVIQEADRQGLLILLDSHRLNDQRIPELWYEDGFTEADWIDTWKMLADRYKNQSNVIGADLKNEPHGRASWGTNDQGTDWRLAAERAGNAILAVNPNWLIVVEGVEENVPGQKLARHWMGGNLEGVERFPVRLSRPNKLVYSPHEYGPGVFNQTWFSEPSFPNNLPSRWETGFNYIVSKGIAPVFVGEFGGRQVDNTSKEGIWQRQFVNYIRQNNLNFAYWSWNPNSSDTGGILQDDWRTVHADKQELLRGILNPSSVATNPTTVPNVPQTPSPKPVVTNLPPSPKPIPSPVAINPLPNPKPSFSNPTSGQGQLKIASNMHSDWHSGFCVSMQVTNQGPVSIRDWQVRFQMNQAAINNTWNGNFSPQGSQYVVTPMDWGRVIEPGQSRELGFCANKLGSDYQPRQLTVSMR